MIASKESFWPSSVQSRSDPYSSLLLNLEASRSANLWRPRMSCMRQGWRSVLASTTSFVNRVHSGTNSSIRPELPIEISIIWQIEDSIRTTNALNPPAGPCSSSHVHYFEMIVNAFSSTLFMLYWQGASYQNRYVTTDRACASLVTAICS
jgi:hypothetical protein